MLIPNMSPQSTVSLSQRVWVIPVVRVARPPPHPRPAITEGIPLQPFEDFKEMRPTDDIQLLVLMTTISQERRGRPDAY